MKIFDDFIETDAADSLSRSNFIFLVQDIKSGNHTKHEATGNAYHVTIKKDGVVIESLWNESLAPITISLELFESILH